MMNELKLNDNNYISFSGKWLGDNVVCDKLNITFYTYKINDFESETVEIKLCDKVSFQIFDDTKRILPYKRFENTHKKPQSIKDKSKSLSNYLSNKNNDMLSKIYSIEIYIPYICFIITLLWSIVVYNFACDLLTYITSILLAITTGLLFYWISTNTNKTAIFMLSDMIYKKFDDLKNKPKYMLDDKGIIVKINCKNSVKHNIYGYMFEKQQMPELHNMRTFFNSHNKKEIKETVNFYYDIIFDETLQFQKNSQNNP